ncbi:MAG: helix-turn-helix domain-containing protein [Dehalococcoidia bacterium]
MTLYTNDFSSIFSKLLEKTNISCYQISKYSHLDQAYLSRLRSGEKGNPSPETIVKISVALAHLSGKINLGDIEHLFNAVGRSIKMNW